MRVKKGSLCVKCFKKTSKKTILIILINEKTKIIFFKL